jgi:hypothetical protein
MARSFIGILTHLADGGEEYINAHFEKEMLSNEIRNRKN